MYSVSAGFKTAADNPQRIPQKRFTFIETVTDYTGFILSLGSFNQQQYEGEELTGSDIIVELQNDTKTFNPFISAKNNIGKIGRVELGFSGEWISRFRGYLEEVEFVTEERPKLNLRFSSKAQRAIERSLGSEGFPLDYSYQKWNPADLAWDLLTVRAGLDATASTANVDIDYTSWAAYKQACEDYVLELRAHFTGQSISEALRLIGELTDAIIYGETDGKFYFRKFIPSLTSPTPYTFSDVSSHIQSGNMSFGKKRLLNKAKVFWGYDPVTDTLGGAVTFENVTSQTNYGLVGREFFNYAVWYESAVSAGSFAERAVSRYGDPLETVTFETKQGTQALIHQIGDEIQITWNQIDYTNKRLRIYGIDCDLSMGTYRILAEDITNQFTGNYMFLDHPTRSILDSTNILA